MEKTTCDPLKSLTMKERHPMQPFAMRIVVAALSIAAMCGSGCSGKGAADCSGVPMFAATDSESRWADIVAKYRKIEKGMSAGEVQQILGRPDEATDLYEPQIVNPRRIGMTWFYSRRPKPEAPRGECEIAVRFDLSSRVTGVESWGVDRLELQASLLREAAARAKAGHREEAVNIGGKANDLSVEVGFQRWRFQYDVPSSWRHISEGNLWFTGASYAIERRQSAEVAAAAMGLLVELGLDQQHDFAKELGECDASCIQAIAREQAVRGHADAAGRWAGNLPTEELRRGAQLGIAEASAPGKRLATSDQRLETTTAGTRD